MRQLVNEQLSLSGPAVDHRHARELETVDAILRDHPRTVELVLQDLERGVHRDQGRRGMAAAQVLRVAVVKQLGRWSYQELRFHLLDSTTYQAFCGYGPFDEIPGTTTLQRNVKAIKAETWLEINRMLVRIAKERKVEDGRKVRTDGTVTETNIHEPSDSSLLWDSVRVLARLLLRSRDHAGVERFPDRTLRAKRRSLEVLGAKRKRKRLKAYRDLLKVTDETVAYAEKAATQLRNTWDPEARALAADLEHYATLADQVIEQTERRVLHGERVPSEEKIVSIFEPHSDIIVKEKRETHFGHKLTVTAGKSGLILDWVVEDGNPADSTLAVRMIERQEELYGRPPRQVAFDGCYASKANLAEIKERGVQDVMFSKKRGLEVTDMTRSNWVYRRLRNFRAGIEAWISFLKRCFGLERCTWKGLHGFHRYVGASVVAANLLTLARHLT